MVYKILNSFQKKSLKERFLFVIGILFFLAYLVLGLLIIFMNNFPLEMSRNYRVAFGILLIVYSFIRFLRIVKDSKE